MYGGLTVKSWDENAVDYRAFASTKGTSVASSTTRSSCARIVDASETP